MGRRDHRKPELSRDVRILHHGNSLIRLPPSVRASGAALAVTLALTGCTSGAGNGSSVTAPEPGPQTMSQWLSKVANCMHGAGWDVTVDADQNGIEMDTLPSSQRGPFRESLAKCERESGPQPNETPITADVAANIYKHLVSMKACLADHGVSTSEPPSQAAFVDDYLSGQAPWSPYSEIPDDTGEARRRELYRDCPQTLDQP